MNIINLLLPLTLIIVSTLNFLNYLKTNCTAGYWGFGSCGKEAWVAPVVMFLIASYLLYHFLRTYLKTKRTEKNILHKKTSNRRTPSRKVRITKKRGQDDRRF